MRIWVLDAGPRHGSGFHVVGGQSDTVWQEGAYLLHPGTTGGRKPSAEPSTGDDSEIPRQAISYGSSRGSYRCRTMPLNQFLKEGERRLLTLGKDLHFLTKLSDGYTASDALEISSFHF